jgi:8-oxo-dGTP pyrophosphatase MutT (NUDIX family)
MLQELSRQLRQRLALPLPGQEAQYQMAHPERKMNSARIKIPNNARHGAVLILLYEEDEQIFFPLIERTEYDGVHSGQIALPGGKFDLMDITYSNTALRETQEEIGVLKRDIEIIGELTELYIPPSNFLVHPFVGIIPYRPLLIPDQKEVKNVLEVDLEYIMDETRIKEKDIKVNSGITVRTPYIAIEEHTIWGATAMMLSEFKSVLFEIGH